jgi:hypothetical protein
LNLVVPGRNRLATLFAVGTCFISFDVSTPSADSILGPGVSEADRSFMWTEGGDPSKNGYASIYVRGHARRGNELERFEWFSDRFYSFGLERCSDVRSPSLVTTINVELRSAEVLSAALVVHGEEFFRSNPGESNPLRFEPFAAADVDHDQQITPMELENAPISPDKTPIPGLGPNPTLANLWKEQVALTLFGYDSGCIQ